MRHALGIFSVVAVLVAVSGCGSTDDSTPVACRDGGGVYLSALGHAPRSVLLHGDTPISECFAKNQTGGDLATVGATLLAVTTRLNAEARSKPGGEANLELGYLLGAAQHGASETDGIHAELIRRLSAAARYSPDNRPLPASFQRTYREGFDAGEARG